LSGRLFETRGADEMGGMQRPQCETFYRAECDVLDDVVRRISTVHCIHHLCMSEPHRSRRKVVGNVRLNVFVIICVTVNQRRECKFLANYVKSDNILCYVCQNTAARIF